MRNIEFKAYAVNPELLPGALDRLGARLERTYSETDTYFNTRSSRLKYRSGSDRLPRLIAYERTDNAKARESRLQLAECQDQDDLLKQILVDNLGISTVVTKTRSVYRANGWLANVDVVEGANFVEVEVFDEGNGIDSTQRVSRELMHALGVRDFDLVPWSYEILHTMLRQSREYQKQLGNNLHKLILIDGASGAGKSSVAAALRETVPNVAYVHRRTTRPPRGEASEQHEYIFVTQDEFARDVAAGEYLESKNFLFGMSYGLHWHDVTAALTAPTNAAAFGLINLGTIAHVREVAPSATTILLTADEATIRRRLLSRRAHSDDALQERLENARRATQVADRYTHVIENHDGELDKVVNEVRRIVEDVANGADT
ncbi:Guanylate kinase [Amycolatopsis xylanica]|uniref:Guanylate kinase n=1 Tax=Amycolatopsis xylanica TaxID=589385 RepID=A0A1H3J8P3_9PSEU|nr:CYTH domain-containing protein [Amycolatopsis xylanica]SDY36380.1 Guanylate kinase [Amycolatopsis xylanica]